MAQIGELMSRDALSTALQWVVAALIVLLLLGRYWSFAKEFYRFAVSHVALMLLIVILYALVFAQVGAGLGLPYLFWHEDFATRVSASWGATLLLGLIGVIAYYLDPLPWATDQKTTAWMVRDEVLKRHVTMFWWGLVGKQPPPDPHPLPQGPQPRLSDRILFALHAIVDPLSVTPFQWLLDPRRENQVRLQRFLRTCRTPFLLLLWAPAVLPGVFSQVPRVAPTGGLGLADPPPIWNVARFLEGGDHLKGYFLGLASWLLGMAVAVTLVKVLIRLTELLPTRPTTGAPPAAVGGTPEWVRADQDCPLARGAAGCPSGDCPRGARISGVGPPSECRARRMMRGSVLVLVLFFLSTYVLLRVVPPLNDLVSPAFAICALLGVIAMAFAIVAQFRPLARPLVVLVVLCWLALVNNRPFKLRFERMTNEYAHPVNLRDRVDQEYFRSSTAPDRERSELVPDDLALTNWLRLADPKQDHDIVDGRPKLVIVSVSGGAARSALWTAVVLDRLEREFPELGRRIRIISGASGGMLGTAYYVRHRLDLAPSGAVVRAQIAAHVQAAPSPPPDWVESLPHDSMEPLAKYIALREIWQALAPETQAEDRGIALERDWHGIRFPLRLLAPVERAGEIPSLIFSPMMIEDGRQLLISNLDLYRDSKGDVLERPIPKTLGRDVSYNNVATDLQSVSLSGVEFYRLFPTANEFLLSTAVRMNASFPFVSPAVNLPCDPPRRIVDAGYYDNYGIQVAAGWLNQNRSWLAEHTSGVLWIQIRDSSGERDRLDVKDEPPSRWAIALRGFQLLTSPVDAVIEARYMSASFRNDTDVAGPNDQFLDALRGVVVNSEQFCTTVIFENSADVTMGDEDVWAELGKLYNESCLATPIMPVAPTHDGVREVAMTWYLTRAERLATRRAIPPNEFPERSPLADPANRECLLQVLKGQVFATLEPHEEDRLARKHGERALQQRNELTALPAARRDQAIRDAGLAEMRRLGLLCYPPGPERDVRLKRLEQLRNYERIQNLRSWWTQSGKRMKSDVR
jgi:hypothetical protein